MQGREILSFFKRTIAAQTHLVTCLASIAGTVLLVEKCAAHSAANHICANLIFGLTATFLFAVSSFYHFLHDGFQISEKTEARLEKLDHVAIYLFIAGTYTAVLMNTVANPWADRLLFLIWTVAFLGSLYTLFKKRLPLWAQHRFVYTGLFVMMGWLFTIRGSEIIGNIPKGSLYFFAIGCLSYSIGAIVYATQRPVLIRNTFGFHELWHVLVTAGFTFHYLTILQFYF
jgi:hemolysin III